MKLYQSLHYWHRKIGMVAALFVILLAVTGLFLNHTEDLALDQKYVQNNTLLDWYQIAPVEAPLSFSLKNHYITLVGERLFFDQIEIADSITKLLGGIEIDQTFVIAADQQLVLLSEQGEVLEFLGDAEGVPAGMQRIGIVNNQFVVQAAHGEYLADLNALTWLEKTTPFVQWSTSSETPAELKNQLLQVYRGKGLTLERVMLDLHSGRILGSFGVYLVDAAAILFLVLACSGVWMWSRRRSLRNPYKAH